MSSLPHFVGGAPSTNSIESLNYQLRKVSKNRGHFPSDEAVIKLLWLAICDIEDKRARERNKEKGLPPSTPVPQYATEARATRRISTTPSG